MKYHNFSDLINIKFNVNAEEPHYTLSPALLLSNPNEPAHEIWQRYAIHSDDDTVWAFACHGFRIEVKIRWNVNCVRSPMER